MFLPIIMEKGHADESEEARFRAVPVAAVIINQVSGKHLSRNDASFLV